MQGDGNGWVEGPNGQKMWGKHGAAGLFLQATRDGDPVVLMQHRAPWTAQGDTWGIPGGARDSHETASQAALRETAEECGIDGGEVDVEKELVTSGPAASGWTYTTVLARVRSGEPLETTANEESVELRWVPLKKLEELPLHPGLRAALPNILRHTVSHD